MKKAEFSYSLSLMIKLVVTIIFLSFKSWLGYPKSLYPIFFYTPTSLCWKYEISMDPHLFLFYPVVYFTMFFIYLAFVYYFFFLTLHDLERHKKTNNVFLKFVYLIFGQKSSKYDMVLNFFVTYIPLTIRNEDFNNS